MSFQHVENGSFLRSVSPRLLHMLAAFPVLSGHLSPQEYLQHSVGVGFGGICLSPLA